jgi:hypothetical protein
MNSQGVKSSYVKLYHGTLFLCTEFIAFDEPNRILSVAFAMRRIAVHVVNEFLQLIETHIH